jgi:hypothetical protein
MIKNSQIANEEDEWMSVPEKPRTQKKSFEQSK